MIVRYPDSGLANIIGQLLEQKLKEREKMEIAKKMRGKIVLEMKDLNAYATLEFKGEVVEATNDKTENANASISANFETFQKLLSASTLKVIWFIISGKLKIRGFDLALKFGRLIS